MDGAVQTKLVLPTLLNFSKSIESLPIDFNYFQLKYIALNEIPKLFSEFPQIFGHEPKVNRFLGDIFFEIQKPYIFNYFKLCKFDSKFFYGS